MQVIIVIPTPQTASPLKVLRPPRHRSGSTTTGSATTVLKIFKTHAIYLAIGALNFINDFFRAILVTFSCLYRCIIAYYSAVQPVRAASVLNKISCQLTGRSEQMK